MYRRIKFTGAYYSYSAFLDEGGLEDELVSSIREFSATKNKFEITLKDFAASKPKVIFVAVAKSEVLNGLYQSFADHIFSENKFPLKKDDRPFHPHVTLAARRFYKRAFQEAWEIFSKRYFSVMDGK